MDDKVNDEVTAKRRACECSDLVRQDKTIHKTTKQQVMANVNTNKHTTDNHNTRQHNTDPIKLWSHNCYQIHQYRTA